MARKTTITGDGIRDDSITGDDVDESTLILDTLRDVDGDTKIQIEESALSTSGAKITAWVLPKHFHVIDKNHETGNETI